MKLITEKQLFSGGVQFLTIPENTPQKFIAGDTTPSVLNQSFWIANNGSPLTITQFEDGAQCQRIYILGDGNTTIANNSSIKTNTGANKLLAVDKIYTFTSINGVWYEDE